MRGQSNRCSSSNLDTDEHQAFRGKRLAVVEVELVHRVAVPGEEDAHRFPAVPGDVLKIDLLDPFRQ